MSSPESETEDLSLSSTENCETLIEQTHTKPQETKEFKLNQPRETFTFKPSFLLGLVSKWMIGLTGLELYNSIFIITEGNIKFELYTELFFEVFPFCRLRR